MSRPDEIEARWAAIDKLSREHETLHGWDSLHTMETNYPRNDAGAIVCVMPDCTFRRHEPRAMFVHVHFGPHGASYGIDIDEFAAMALRAYPQHSTADEPSGRQVTTERND